MNDRKDDAATLSGAYALNALDAAERELFEALLAESEETRNEVTELMDTAVLLGLAVDPVEPSAALRASILSKLATTPQLDRVVAPAAERVAHRFSPAAQRAKARWFTRPVTVLVAAAAAIVLIVGGGVVANTISTNNFENQQADQLAAINSADDSQRLVAEVDGGGTATLVWSTDLKSSALIVDGLAPLSAEQVYALWYIDAEGARAAGTFSVGEGGSVWRVLDGQMGFGDTVGVTIEPRGGSTIPTTDPIVVFESA